MDSKIKNVIFDLGGVLINLDFDSCLNAFRTAGFTNIEEQVRQMQGNGVFSRFDAFFRKQRKNVLFFRIYT